MIRFLSLCALTFVLSGCISRNTDPGLAGNGLNRITCPQNDSDNACGAKAAKACQAKGFGVAAGLSFGQETRFIQNNCTVVGGARICSPATTSVKTATFICTN